MSNLSQNQSKIFKGAGWLLGISLSIIAALVVFTLSDSFAAAISAAFPIGFFSGISLEQKFQREIEPTDPKKTKIIIRLILFGFLFFVALYFII